MEDRLMHPTSGDGVPAWLSALMAEEPLDDAEGPRRMPAGALRLRPGQRVEFDLHEGPDGQWYATSVRPLQDDDG
ncbi:hypothetical protein VI08_10290 [Luteibacter yeojuensis]|uniref:Uncharacterized protein n=1 Tax=Luteibacter yeojuensis TaxID=345309 RepID=A0A0F3KRF6_9GAMM|nr:hypothetical protein VI08_10290 [Luteibacter yeojuensis]